MKASKEHIWIAVAQDPLQRPNSIVTAAHMMDIVIDFFEAKIGTFSTATLEFASKP